MSTQHTSSSSPRTVSVVGLGPMGRAIARALLGHGVDVTVWNRSPEKAADLVAAGATLASTASAAFSASSLVVVCVIDGDAVSAVVDTLETPFSAQPVVVNLTSDSPARTKRLAEQMELHGLAYLDGAITTPAATIGGESARILLAGPQESLESIRPLLEALGGGIYYVGSDIAAAATVDVALLSMFWTAFAGVAQALALVRAEGVDTETFAPHATAMSQLVVELLPTLAQDAAARRFSGADSAALDSVHSSLGHLRAAFRDAQVSTAVLDALAGVVAAAVRVGHGPDAPIVLSEYLATTAPPEDRTDGGPGDAT